jgi:hypothetical protein
VSAKLQGPPSEPVEWEIEHRGEDLYFTIHTVAQTAWQAHMQVCSKIPGTPSFGQCKVTRAK